MTGALSAAESDLHELFARPGEALKLVRSVTDQLRGRPPATSQEYDSMARTLIAEAFPNRRARPAVDRLCTRAGRENVAVLVTLASLAKTARLTNRAPFDSKKRMDSIQRLEAATENARARLHPDLDAPLLEQLARLMPSIRQAGRQTPRVRRGPRVPEGKYLEWTALFRALGASKADAEAIVTNVAPVPINQD